MSENKLKDLKRLWAAVRHAQRLSDRIRQRMAEGKMPDAEDAKEEEGIAVVPIKESVLRSRRRLVRRTAR
jgi:hypothetical protein